MGGDLLSGTYTLSSGDADAAVIDVADYDTKAVQDGIWKGTYTISGAPVEDEDGNSYDPFGGMQLIFTADGADEDSIDWNLAIAAGGATLGSVSPVSYTHLWNWRCCRNVPSGQHYQGLQGKNGSAV